MRKLKLFVILLIIINISLILLNLEISGYIYHNDFNALKYEIQGIDMSHHQEKVNWNNVDKKYKFVLMKATEGKDFLDIDFNYNWNKARISGFYVGAYHFFTMTSSGSEQAKYYISKVPKVKGTFPPIVDFEISSKYDKKIVLKEIMNFKDIIEKYYERKLIIYTNYKSYNKYLKNEFVDNKIWIRDIKWIPSIEENDRWVIWQYSNRGRIKGIDGFIDKNVLRHNIDYYIKYKK